MNKEFASHVAGDLAPRDRGIRCRESRLALLTDIVAPHRIPIFNSLGNELGERFKVFFLGASSPSRGWKVPLDRIRFEYTILKGFRLLPLRHRGYNQFLNWGVETALGRFRPSVVVVGGYHNPSAFMAARYTRRSGSRLFLWCESTLHDARSNGAVVDWLKRTYLGWCDGFLVPGQASLDYLRSFGVDEERIIRAPNAVDVEYFASASERYRTDENRDRFRREHSLPRFVVIFVGRLSPEKGFPTLLDILEQLEKRGAEVGLVVVGDGPMRASYEAMIQRRRIPGVVFVGFQQPEAMPYYYAQSDVLILPSISEPWGLVVNEAMACGLPVLCSCHVGAGFDLEVEGETGYRCRDVHQYVQGMLELIQRPSLADSMRAACLRVSKMFAPSACADGFLQALNAGSEEARPAGRAWRSEGN